MSHVSSAALLDSFTHLLDFDRQTPPPTPEEQAAARSASEARARRLSRMPHASPKNAEPVLSKKTPRATPVLGPFLLPRLR